MIVDVTESSQVAAARRVAQAMATKTGLDEVRTGKVALIATELATNLIKHAGGGRLVIGSYADGSGTGVEVMSIDAGGGIADLARAMEDGTSTAGSRGHGLGTIRRQADVFDIFTQPGRGTVLMARIAHSKADAGGNASVVIGSVVAPHPGETEIGDGWSFTAAASGPTVMMVDGSGHGPLAHAAAEAAIDTFHAHAEKPCATLVDLIHQAMAHTRGGAVAIARVVRSDRTVRFVGIGNIAGVVLTNGEAKRMVSNNGIAGHVAARIREFSYPYGDNAAIVLHSDGLSGRWDLSGYPGLAFRHPSAIAGVLFRDHYRGRDDVSIVALRI